MNRRVVLASLIVLASASWVAAANVKFLSTWKAPDANNLTFAGRKVVCLVMSGDDALRMSAEEALARELTARGVEGVSAYRLIPREEIRDRDRAKGWFERSGAAGVIVMRLVDVARETTPPSVMWGTPMYGSLWSYYPYGWGSTYVFVPGHDDLKIVVETLAFDIAGDRLLWAGTSQTTNPKNVQAFMKDLVKACADQMRKQGLTRKAKA